MASAQILPIPARASLHQDPLDLPQIQEPKSQNLGAVRLLGFYSRAAILIGQCSCITGCRTQHNKHKIPHSYS